MENVPGGSSGIFTITSTVYKGQAVYVQDVRNDETYNFTNIATEGNYKISWEEAITTKALLHPMKDSTSYIAVELPTDLNMPAGSQLMLETDSPDDTLIAT